MTTYTITGKLTEADGKRIANATIQILEEKLKTTYELVTTQTNKKGNFSCQFEHDNSEINTLIISDKNNQTISKRHIRLLSSEENTIHLVAGDKAYKGPAEINRLQTLIQPHLDGMKLEEIDEDKKVVLKRLSGISIVKIQNLVEAKKLSKKYNIANDPLFACLNSGEADNLIKMAKLPADSFNRILDDAVDENKIPEKYKDDIIQQKVRNRILNTAAKEVLNTDVNDPYSTSSLIGVIGLGKVQRKEFVKILFQYPINSQGFWEMLQQNDITGTKTALKRIQRIINYTGIVGLHAPSLKALNRKVGNKNDPSVLVRLNRTDWSEFVKNKISEIPDRVEGSTEEERQNKYADELYAIVEQKFPGKMVRDRMLKSKSIGGRPGKDLKKFLRKNQLNFEVDKTDINTFFHKNKDEIESLNINIETTKQELKTWRRLYHITPEGERFNHMESLKNLGVNSATQLIHNYSKAQLRTAFGEVNGSFDTAELIYYIASEKVASTAALAVNVQSELRPVPEAMKVDDDVKEEWRNNNTNGFQIPDFSTLFGNQAYCSCKHCRSVLSPAAYLVDLLQFLEKTSSDTDRETAYKKLNTKRPDIPNISLNCANTNTAMPYIDLAIEVLEQQVVGNKDFEKQTTWTTEEVQAMPEHLNGKAYNKLSKAVFPFNLPFNLYNKESNFYLEKLGINRYELLRVFKLSESSSINDETIAKVHLGLSETEFEIISGISLSSIESCWSVSSINELCSFDVFLKHSELSYIELQNLLQVELVNPDNHIEIYFEDSITCDTTSACFKYDNGKLQGSGHEEFFFELAHRLIRLSRKVNLDFLELDVIIRGLQAEDIDLEFIRMLSNVLLLKDNFSIDLEEMLTWWSNINCKTDLNNSDDRSLYEKLFLNNAIENPNKEDFELSTDSGDYELKGARKLMEDGRSFIAGALGVSTDDCVLIENFENLSELSLVSLSILHRYISLSSILDISISELVACIELLPVNPFNSIEETHSFIESFEVINKSHFSIEEIKYIITGEDESNKSLAISDSQIDAIVDSIQNYNETKESSGETNTDEQKKEFACQTLSESFGIDISIVELLYEHLLLPVDTDNNTNELNTWHRVILFCIGISIDSDDLEWIINNWNSTPINGLSFIDFCENSITIENKISSFLAMISLSELMNGYQTEDVKLTDVLIMAKGPGTLINKKSNYAEKLSTLTGWDETKVHKLISSKILRFKPVELATGFAIQVSEKLISLINHFGVEPDQFKKWLNVDMNKFSAAAIRASLKSNYTTDNWYRIGTELRNKLRQKQRDALSGYLINKLTNVEDEHDLFDYLLLDTQTEPCMLTSRIKQAISSVQLLIHRCFLGLEDVELAHEDEEKDVKQLWEWMKNYRVWEANRKVFLWPENYLYPELRLSKSELFDELEAELRQNDLDEGYIRNAFIHYLEKLDEISNLVIVASCKEEKEYEYEEGVTVVLPGESYKKLHVFGRTQSQPYQYYHRYLTAETGRWSYWKKINLGIEGEYLVPVVFNGRLFVFWPVVKENSISTDEIVDKYLELFSSHHDLESDDIKSYISEAKADELNLSVDEIIELLLEEYLRYLLDNFKNNYLYFDIQLAKSEYKNGSWSDVSLSSDIIQTDNEVTVLRYISNQYLYDISQYAFTLQVTDDKILVNVIQNSLDKSIRLPVLIKTISPGCDILSIFDFYIESVGYKKMSEYLYILTNSEYKIPSNEYDKIGDFTFKPSSNHLNGNQYDEPINWELELPYACKTNYVFIESKGNTSNLLFDGDQIFYNINDKIKISVPEGLRSFSKSLDFFYNDSSKKYFVKSLKSNIPIPAKLQFKTFFHPFIANLMEEIYDNDLSELLSKKVQNWTKDNFERYKPGSIVSTDYPIQCFEFDFSGVYSYYNWEIFYHIPMLVAQKLTLDQQFESAQKYYHLVFNPTTTNGVIPQRYWRLKPFSDFEDKDNIAEQLYALTLSDYVDGYTETAKEVELQISSWLNNPFDPHAVAEMRISAYMINTVFSYVDNLIKWGDYLFQQDTLETLNEATNIYILAARILGKKPGEISSSGKYTDIYEGRSYSDLTERGFDSFSNTIIEEFELYLPTSKVFHPDTGLEIKFLIRILEPYFCVPFNEQMLSYWDTVDNRLFKIRHCLNIEGIYRILPLFQPPIDPMLLVRAKAMGLDIASVLYDMTVNAPIYRFRFYIQKAMQFVSDVQSLGGALLGALEKTDAEQLAVLRSLHENQLLTAATELEEIQLNEAKQVLESTLKQKEIINERHKYYSNLEKISDTEKSALNIRNSAEILQIAAQLSQSSAAIASLIPEFAAGFYGYLPSIISQFGGSNSGGFNERVANALSIASSIQQSRASRISTISNYDRRWEEWKLQERIAKKELENNEEQILAAEIRVDIAKKKIENLELQLKNQEETYEFMTNKYTNVELYDWMTSQLSTLYYQSYEIARQCALRAQDAFNHELGTEEFFIRSTYWDSLKKGLLTGENLVYDLKRMEMSYYENNSRNHEITKNISLALLNPLALLDLKELGSCDFDIPELLFDFDFPGHYFRRIKSVSLTIPCVAGPNTSINATLTLNSNKTKVDTSGNSKSFSCQTNSIATSRSQNDSGLFQLNFEDERNLPFEGAGIDSSWKLQLPSKFKAFDYNTISDVIIQLNYTAKDGGDTYREDVENDMKNELLGKDYIRLFSLKQEFSNEWYRFLNPSDDGSQEMIIELTKDKFPYIFREYLDEISTINIHSIESSEGSTSDVIMEMVYEGDSKGQFGRWKLMVSDVTVTSDIVKDIVLLVSYSVQTK